MKVKLFDIIEALESACEEFVFYYHKPSEKIVMRGDYMITGFVAEELEEDLEENWDDYLRLPDRFAIDEYSMMEDFVESLPEGSAKNNLESSLHGRGAFSRFKTKVHQFDLADAWYRYRDESYVEIAKSWCHDNGIECDES